jgi:hypothetical protein
LARRRLTLAKPHRIHILGKNRLLSALPKAEHERLLPKLVKVALPLREILVEANEPISRVFFPLTGVVSLVIVVEGGVSLEVGTIGNEGMVGIPVFLGSERYRKSLARRIRWRARSLRRR